MDQRQVSLVNRVKVPFKGSLLPGACVLGDVDDDGDQELVAGNCDGKLYVYKHGTLRGTRESLGTIVSVFVSRTFFPATKENKPHIVVVNAEGECHILVVPPLLGANEDREVDIELSTTFEIPWNVSCAQLFDFYDDNDRDVLVIATHDGGAASETTVLALTTSKSNSKNSSMKRRSGVKYGLLDVCDEWCVPGVPASMSYVNSGSTHNGGGKLILLGLQFGGLVSLTQDGSVLQHCLDNSSRRPMKAKDIGVASPGRDVFLSRDTGTSGLGVSGSTKANSSLLVNRPMVVHGLKAPYITSSAEKLATSSVTATSLPERTNTPQSFEENSRSGTPVDEKSVISDPSGILPSNGSYKVPARLVGHRRSLRKYLSSRSVKSDITEDDRGDLAVLCFGGRLRLEMFSDDGSKDYATIANQLIWQEEHDRQLFAVQSLDVNRDGVTNIISCAWDGLTCIYDLENNVVRYQFESRVQGFLAGEYSHAPGQTSVCFIYVTFDNSIVIYHDVNECVQDIPALTLIDVLRRRGQAEAVLNTLDAACTPAEKEKLLQKLRNLDSEVHLVAYFSRLLHQRLHQKISSFAPKSPKPSPPSPALTSEPSSAASSSSSLPPVPLPHSPVPSDPSSTKETHN